MLYDSSLKRQIPFNWKVESFVHNSISTNIQPGVDRFDTKTYIATADVKGTTIGIGSVVTFDGREGRANMQPAVNSVWFAKMKNSVKHLYLNEEMKTFIENTVLSTGFFGLQCTPVSFEYISSFISNPLFEKQKDMLAHGATQEAVNGDDLANMKLIVPDDTVLTLFHEQTKAIWGKISQTISENQQLSALRDWLLPMLMNGQASIID